MHVESIWRFPVKSMMGESLLRADMTDAGMAGDRGWAVRDEVRGGIRRAKKIGGLMRLSARYDDLPGGPVTITLPGGSTVSSDSPGVDATLSEALGHAVSLWPLQPAEDLDHYRRGAPDSDDLLAELRDIFGRTMDEPLPDLSVFPPEVIEFESPPGTYLDAYPILVMTTSAMRSLAEALPDSKIDIRRFRPNLLVDTGDEPGHPELGWRGRSLCAGGVELELVTGCPRCVMVTREIDDSLPADRSVLRHVVRDLDQLVGMYARVTAPGSVSVGDRVSLI
ncbi:MAG: MOSC domain-containing protein [Microthrixaceae bacterium]|nr:MOSC domain-containing protein [Microthrixaceae bacterium]